MNNYRLYDEMTTGPGEGLAFLGADDDVEHVIADAARLVKDRRYAKLQVQDNGSVVARIYRDAEGIWVASPFGLALAEGPTPPKLYDQDAAETLPGVDWARF